MLRCLMIDDWAHNYNLVDEIKVPNIIFYRNILYRKVRGYENRKKMGTKIIKISLIYKANKIKNLSK